MPRPIAVKLLVRLRPWRPHRRPATPVQQLELNPGGVDGSAHETTQRIDLANEVSLCRSADCRIAWHVRHGVRRQRAQPNVTSHAGSRIRRFDASMARTDDDHIESHRELLADAEVTEDVVQRFLARAGPDDFAETRPRAVKIDEHEFLRRALLADRRTRARQRRARLLQSNTCRRFEIAAGSRNRSSPVNDASIARLQLVRPVFRSVDTRIAPSIIPLRRSISICWQRRAASLTTTARADARSSSVNASPESITISVRSATSRARAARETPSRSTASLRLALSCRVDQGDRRGRRDRSSRSGDLASSLESSVTIARSCPISALKRLDFPALTRPAITTVAPSRINRPRASCDSSAFNSASESPMRAATSLRLDEVKALVRKVERRLEPGDQVEQHAIECLRSVRSASLPTDRTPFAPAAASPRQSDRQRLLPVRGQCVHSGMPEA